MSQDDQAVVKRHYFSARKRVWLMFWGLLRLVIVLPVWLLALVFVILGWALSPWGTGVLLSQAEQRDWIQLESHQGSLFERLELQGFRLEIAGMSVSLGEFEISWAEDCVLSGRLCIDTLRVTDTDIRLPAGTDAPEEKETSAPLEEIRLPFPIELRELVFDNINVRLADGTRIGWERFTSAISAQESRIRIAPTHLERPRVYLPPSPGVLLAGDGSGFVSSAAIDAAIALQTPIEAPSTASLEETLTAREPIVLPEVRLPISLELPSLSIHEFELTGATEYVVNDLQLGLIAEGNDVTLTQLDVTTPDATAQMTANVALTGQYPLSAQLDAELFLPELMPELAGEQISLQLEGAANDLTATLNAQGPVSADLTANIDALAPTLPFRITLDSEQLQWPLATVSPLPKTADDTENAPPEPYVLDGLSLTAEGDLKGYNVDLQVAAQGPSVPESRIALTGQGDLYSFRWAPLSLTVSESQLSSRGSVYWEEALSVDAIIELSQVNPNDLIPSVEGRLDGSLDVSVRQQGEKWTVALPVLDISGELQGYPLTLNAALNADSALNVDLQQLAFSQGENRLNASGRISPDSMDIAAEIDLRGLDTLAPDLQGALTGQIQASGSLEQPQIAADLEGKDLQFGENRLSALQLNADISGIEDPNMNIRLDSSDIAAGGQSLERINLALDGQLSNHRLTLDIAGGAGNELLESATLAIDGQFDQPGQRYQATLTPLEVVSEFGTVSLENALNLAYRLDTGEASLSPFCLRRSEGGVVCSEQAVTASAEAGDAVLSVTEVPMQMLAPFLPEGWSLVGDTTAELAASWRQGGADWQADFDLNSSLEITALNDFGQPVVLPRLRLETQVDANPRQVEANASLALGDTGNINLTLGVSDPLGQAGLEGNLSVNRVRLAPYRPMVVGLETMKGQLDGNVRIAGSVKQPDLQGQLSLKQLQVAGANLPLVIPDGEVNVDFDGNSGRIGGYVDAERGRLNIQGDAVWPADDDWGISIDLNATQNPLLIALPQFGRLEAAPDIRIRVTPDRLQVRGDVTVPWARLEAGELPRSAVGPSSDEIIITERDDREAEQRAEQLAAELAANAGSTAAETLEKGGMTMDVQLNIVLGQDMQLSAYGLDSRLQGTLEVNQDSGGLQLFGDVNLVDGRFQSFGQDLIIRRGKILFSGPPGAPSLDFEAIRNPDITQDDVIAGVKVTGLAEAPNLAIFSNPAMDETRALSYLLRGRAPDESGGGFDSAVATALISMSLGKTGGAVGSIGQAFGINDLRLDTTGAGDNSQVALSGQLTDDISVSYGVGIFTPIAELTLRYTLWRDLYLQAVSGASQAVDLIYQFSRSGNPTTFEAR
ncbi:translocation/assembly module TamB domain-containing protein [Vreelandella aquamarina]